MNLLLASSAADRLGDRVSACVPSVRLLRLSDAGRLHLDSRECDESAARPDAAWLSLDIFTQGLLARFTDLVDRNDGIRWLHTVHAGLDLPFYAALLRRRVRLSNSHVHAPAVAEFVLGQVLAVLQDHDRFRRSQASRHWRRLGFRECAGTRWLVVGLGHVGTQVARRAVALGAHVVGVRRRAHPEPAVERVIAFEDLRHSLPDADIVVISCAATSHTHNLVDAGFLAAMRPGAVLVNVARGALVDEDALLDGLGRGQPGHAVLDVTATEPLPPDSPLWAHPQVRLTAHNAYAGSGTERRGDELFLENLRRYCAREPLLEEVTEV